MNENKKEKLNNTSYKLDLDKLKQNTENDAFTPYEELKLSESTKEKKKLKNNPKEIVQKNTKSGKEKTQSNKNQLDEEFSKKAINKSDSKKETDKVTTKKTNNTKKTRIKRRKKKKKITIILLVLILIVLSASLSIGYKMSNDKKETKQRQDELKQDIISHYNEYVATNKETDIYKLNNSKYEKVGKVGKGEELTLETKEITYEDEYLKINTFEEEYYIHYKDIDAIEKLSNQDNRYKKYIVFNKNIITKDITNFYDEEDNLVYTIPSSFNLPIIINKKDIYGVEFNDRLLYVKKEDVKETKDNKNTNSTNTGGIAVLNYHFFFDASSAEDTAKCNQIICLSTANLKKHLD